MGRDVEIKGVTPVMGQDHENKQQAKAHRRHHQEIRRKPILCVPLINVTSTNLLTTSYVFDVWRTCLTGAQHWMDMRDHVLNRKRLAKIVICADIQTYGDVRN